MTTPGITTGSGERSPKVKQIDPRGPASGAAITTVVLALILVLGLLLSTYSWRYC